MALSNRNSHPGLPPEVVDVIIDHLASDMEALRNCTFVARSWLPRSRHHLFHHLVIPLSRLRRFLRRCEAVGPAVVSLTFQASAGPWNHVAAKLCEKALSGTFMSYTSLTSLSIDGLHFSVFSNLAQLLAAFPRLETISLFDLTWDQDDSTQTPEHPGLFSSLQNISLSGISLGPILEWLARHEFPVLDGLGLGLSSPNESPAGRILAFLAHCVPKNIQIGPPVHPDFAILVRTICDQLHYALHSIVTFIDVNKSFYDLRRLLKPAPQSPIMINQITNKSTMCHIRSWLMVDWAALDDLLACQRLSAFGRVMLLVNDAGGELARAQVCQHLPITSRRGVVAFSNLHLQP
ncbi:hypothetical protein DFH06DRAFT_1484577 [Mycena polygramma]|nr:hypothetical protein DFH06DRAFT_1484577 [Mycena polygramma]